MIKKRTSVLDKINAKTSYIEPTKAADKILSPYVDLGKEIHKTSVIEKLNNPPKAEMTKQQRQILGLEKATKEERKELNIKAAATPQGVFASNAFEGMSIGASNLAFDKDVRNAQKQGSADNKGVAIAGQLIGSILPQAKLYSVVNNTLKGTALGAKIAGLGGVGAFAGSQGVQLLADTIVQAPRETIEAIQEDKSIGQVAKDFAINRAIDIAMNLTMDIAGEGFKKLRTMLSDNSVKSALNGKGIDVDSVVKALDDGDVNKAKEIFYVNQYGAASKNLDQANQLQLPAPTTVNKPIASDNMGINLRTPKEPKADFYTNQFGATDSKPFNQMQLPEPKYSPEFKSDNVGVNLRQPIDIKPKITDELVSSHSGQSDSIKRSFVNGKEVGTLEYTVYKGEPSINMINVNPEFQRKGIATELLQDLQKEYPNTQIGWGTMTTEGKGLKDSITTSVDNAAVIAKQTQLDKISAEIKKLEELPDEEIAKMSDEIGDRWNELSDQQYKLTKELFGTSPTKSIVNPKVEQPKPELPSEFSFKKPLQPTLNKSTAIDRPFATKLKPELPQKLAPTIDRPSEFRLNKDLPTLNKSKAIERPFTLMPNEKIKPILEPLKNDSIIKKFQLDLFGAKPDKPVEAVFKGKTVKAIGVFDENGVKYALLNDGTNVKFDELKPNIKIDSDLVVLKKANLDASKPFPPKTKKVEPTETGTKYRQTIDNSFKKSSMPEESKTYFDANPREYEVYSNKEAWDKAFNKVSADVDKAKVDFLNKTGLETADDTAEAIALLNRVADTGDIEELIKLTDVFAEKGTNAGQAVQAIIMLQKTTPEGKLVQAHNVVKNVEKELKKTPGVYDKLKESGKLPKITKEDAEIIVDAMKKAENLTGDAKKKAIAVADQLIADKIPPTFGDKLRALRNLSLLGNFKTTLIRNPLGNVIFGTLENVSQIPSGITDIMVSKVLKSQRQTKVLPDLKTQLTGFKKGFGDAVSDIKLNIDTSPTRGGIEMPRNRKIFETAWLNKANNWLGDALKLGDRPFYQAAYDARLKELKDLMPNADLKELEKLASEFGLERTFQNMSKTSMSLSKMKQGLNGMIGGETYGLGDIVMPYTQTPANILAKGVQYTPLNIINVANMAFGKKQGSVAKNIIANQKNFTDAVGRMFTGSGIIALGYTLAKNGYVTGKSQDTSNKAKDLRKSAGEQQYSIKIGDKWYSYDWAQPASIPLALGIDFYNASKDEELFLSALTEGAISGGETLMNQGVMQGIMRMFGGYSPIENVAESLITAPTQLLPTLMSQTAQTKDKYKRDVDYSNPFNALKTQAMKKVPILRETLPASLNMFGEQIKEQSGATGINKGLLTYLSPSLVSKETDDPIIKETYRLFSAVEDTDVIPSYTPSALKQAEEKRNFKLIYGKMAKQELSFLYNSSVYKSYSDSEKSKKVISVLGSLKNKAKSEYNDKYKTNLK